PSRPLSLRRVRNPPLVEIRASTSGGTVTTMLEAPAFRRTPTSPVGFGRTMRAEDAPVFRRASVTRTSERSTSNSPAPAFISNDAGTSLAIRTSTSAGFVGRRNPTDCGPTCSRRTSTRSWRSLSRRRRSAFALCASTSAAAPPLTWYRPAPPLIMTEAVVAAPRGTETSAAPPPSPPHPLHEEQDANPHEDERPHELPLDGAEDPGVPEQEDDAHQDEQIAERRTAPVGLLRAPFVVDDARLGGRGLARDRPGRGV